MPTANQRKSTRQAARRQTQRATSKPSCLQAVLQYVKDGWSVIPLEPRGKTPRVEWKPYQTIPATQEQVSAWWRQWPDANVGIVTGTISDLLVLDIDGEEGEATLTELEKKHGSLPPTITVTTGRGRHLYFACPSASIGSTVRAFGIGVDVRCEGGYVVAPPSVHANGARYRWNSDATQSLARAPQWLVAALASPSQSEATLGTSSDDKIYEGQRNSTLTSLAGALRRKDCGEATILAALQVENSSRCVPPLPQTELEAIAQSVAQYRCETDQAPYSDLGNAKRLITAHGRDLLYCTPWTKWLVWDGSRWSLDQKSHITRLAKETLQDLSIKVATATDAENRNLAIHLLRSQSAGHIAAMVDLAKCEPGIPVLPEELDTDPWLLAVQNGTVDLRTGELKVSRREDRISKLAPVTYDPKAACPTWEQFVSRVLAEKPDLIRFVQQAIGYSLTGSAKEQVLFFLYGTGANGKSTLLNSIGALLGDYARQTSADTLLVKRGDGISNDIARLQGSRFVSAVEAEQGRSLAEALVKRLTGGDKITARYLYREHFEFEPTFKLWVGVNHKPNIRGTDEAIWRRIHVIPFTVTIPPAERDKNLGDKLRAELPGILNWAMEGCLDWQKHGLIAPREVQAATDTYREEMDVLDTFLRERCREEVRGRVSLSLLYDEYVNWCGGNGERQLNNRDFTTRLKERGIKQGRNTQERFWIGIALKGHQQR